MWRMTFVEREYAPHFWHTLVSTAWHNPYTLKYMIFHIAFYLLHLLQEMSGSVRAWSAPASPQNSLGASG